MITDINCDGEFDTIMYDVNDKLNITMKYTSKGEHVLEAERSNGTIGKRIRATYHNLSYKIIPRIMSKYLEIMCTEQLNLLPTKGGVSKYLIPHVIMTNRDLDLRNTARSLLELFYKLTRRKILPIPMPPKISMKFNYAL